MEVLSVITFHAVGAFIGRWLGVAFVGLAALLAIFGSRGAGTIVLGALGLLLLAGGAFLRRNATVYRALERRGVNIVPRSRE